MIERLTPLRGEEWEVAVPRVGPHPAAVLTVNVLRDRLSEVTVAMITGTAGPAATRIALSSDAGVAKYPESYVDATSIHTVPLSSFRRRRGLLHPSELRALDSALRLVLGLG